MHSIWFSTVALDHFLKPELPEIIAEVFQLEDLLVINA